MIYYNYIDPAQAKPGDYMIETKGEYVHLYLCIRSLSDNDMNGWWIIKRFSLQDYSSEIIDSKPTPALIARFTSGGGKRFEAPGCTLIYRCGNIFEVEKIRKEATSFYITSDKLNTDESFKLLKYDSNEQAESERARLIEWLEEA